MKLKSYVGTVVYFLGLLFVYAGERLAGSGSMRTTLTSIGLVAVVGAFVARLVQSARTSADRKNTERGIAWFYAIGVGALLLYFIQSDLWTSVADKTLAVTAPKIATVLAALWPVLLVASLLPLLFSEMAYASMERAPVIERERVKDAARTGLGVAAALVFAFCVAYVAEVRDARWDLSYFRTTKPGEATRKLVQSLAEPLDVAIFYPPGNEVGLQVREYFQDLKRESPHLRVTELDQAIEPAKAREIGVTSNGVIVVHRKARKEQMFVGTDIERARGQLRNLDKDVNQRLLQVARSQRVVYLTSGHEEAAATNSNPLNPKPTVRQLRDMLTSLNYDVRDLSAAEGLATEVPKDAAAVLVIGPQKSFLPEELAAVNRYLDRGGRILLALDPEPSVDFSALLKPFGLTYRNQMLANASAHVPHTGQLSDRTLILTASFSSHPSVTALGQLMGRTPVVFLRAGHLEDLPERAPNIRGDVTVRAHPETFNDLNGDFELQTGIEVKHTFTLGWAGVKAKAGAKPEEEGRVIFMSDSDFLSDAVLQNPGNAYLALDTAKWLVGDEALSGGVTSEVDTPIQHTRKQDVVWFYSTIFLLPALLVLVGYLVTRGRGGRKPVPQSQTAGGVAMKVGAVGLQAALAAGGLLLAYFAWQRPPEAAPDSVIALDASKNDIQKKIRFEGEGKFFELTRDTSGSEPAAWLHQGPRPVEAPKPVPVPGPDGGLAAAPPPPPEGPPMIDRTVRGNDTAEKVFEKFAPLHASRALGVVSGDKLKELGLEGATKRIIVTSRNGETVFLLGAPPQGAGASYLRNEKDGRVYLLQGGGPLAELEFADSRLTDRRLHDFLPDELDGWTLKANSKQRELVRTADSPPLNPKWAAKSTPDKVDEFAKNWHDKVWRLAPVEVLGKGEAPKGGEPTIKVRIDYQWKGKPKGFVELGRSSTNESFARSEFSAGWVKIHESGGELLKEAEKIVAGP